MAILWGEHCRSPRIVACISVLVVGVIIDRRQRARNGLPYGSCVYAGYCFPWDDGRRDGIRRQLALLRIIWILESRRVDKVSIFWLLNVDEIE